MSLMFSSLLNPSVPRTLLSGGIAIIPTDTLYGIVGQASNMQAVERIYELKNRDNEKPLVVLAANINQLKELPGLDAKVLKIAQKFWPAALSVIVPCEEDELFWIHRGKNSVACRIPDNEDLRQLLLQTGPLVAPSANPQGLAPSTNILEAKDYFGEKIDVYVDGGKIESTLSSTIVSFKTSGKPVILRSGTYLFNKGENKKT